MNTFKRKAFQIAISQDDTGHTKVAALCNDDTIWIHQPDIGWEKLPDIPQAEALSDGIKAKLKHYQLSNCVSRNQSP